MFWRGAVWGAGGPQAARLRRAHGRSPWRRRGAPPGLRPESGPLQQPEKAASQPTATLLRMKNGALARRPQAARLRRAHGRSPWRRRGAAPGLRPESGPLMNPATDRKKPHRRDRVLPPDAAVRFSKAIMRFSAFSAPQRRLRPPAWGAAAPPAGWRPPRQKLR